MSRFPFIGLLVTLAACYFNPAVQQPIEAARKLDEKWKSHPFRVEAAGNDCLVLLVRAESALDDAAVESIQYGTDFTAYAGGIQQFVEDHRFRAAVYKDSNGGLWTYGSITREEARSMPTCRKRALLIGIDDYTAHALPRPSHETHHPGWPDLQGAVADVGILRNMLVENYGFDARNIVTLTNEQATRDAILQSMERHLVRPARKGDVVFFYFAGHGTQIPNAASDELDRLDEAIVPADSRLGVPHIRDKELRPLFNRILDRGAYLTLILDHCNSGSGFRSGARPIVDPGAYGPRPEERGALVLAGSQDADESREMRGEDGQMHGAFTWAWIRALRDGAPNESAQETFLRAQARLRLEKPSQAPVMLGSAEARLRPFLSVRRRPDRGLIGVERVNSDGAVVLQGGWANGLSAGTTLRNGESALRVTRILGPGRSVAQMETGRAVSSGALIEPTTRTRSWHSLESPTPSPYHLALRREKTNELLRKGMVFGGETYSVVLCASRADDVTPRYYYVVIVDSFGKSYLAFPRSGSVENRFPLEEPVIDLGDSSAIRIVPPYGVDTYVLLSTDEPLPNPSILTWDGLRTPRILPGRWSIERVQFESVPRRS